MTKRYYFFIILAIVMIAIQMVWPFSYETLDYFGQYVTLLLPAILYVLVTKQSFKEVFKLKKINAKSLILTFTAFLALQPVMAFLGSLNNAIHIGIFGEQSLQGAMPSYAHLGLLASLFVTAVTPAICEEAVMRGVMLPLKFNGSIHKMAVINGILFGVFHFNFPQLAYPIALGAVVTYFVLITKSIIPAVLIHFMNNGVSSICEIYPSFERIMFGYEQGPSFIANNQTALFIYQFSLAVIAVVALVFIIKKLAKYNNYDVFSQSSTDTNEVIEVVSKKQKLLNLIPICMIILMYIQLVFNAPTY